MGRKTYRNARAGFTLIELLVVVLIIGILAAIAVPQYFKVVEKGKFAETTEWISSLKGAQERYLAKNGVYVSGAVAATTFDANLGTLKRFTVGNIATSGTPDYTLTFTRIAPCLASRSDSRASDSSSRGRSSTFSARLSSVRSSAAMT